MQEKKYATTKKNTSKIRKEKNIRGNLLRKRIAISSNLGAGWLLDSLTDWLEAMRHNAMLKYLQAKREIKMDRNTQKYSAIHLLTMNAKLLHIVRICVFCAA